MGLTAFNAVVSINWRYSRDESPFGKVNQGPDSRSWNLNGLDLAVFDNAYINEIIVAPGTGAVIDLTDLNNLVQEAFGLDRVLLLAFLPSGDGSICRVSPNTGPNPFLGPFETDSSAILVQPGGVFIVGDPAVGDAGTEGPGNWPVAAGHKELLVGNVGHAPMSVIIVVAGSTTIEP